MFDWCWSVSVLSVISFYCKTWGAIRALSGRLMVRTNLINAGYCSLTGLAWLWWSHCPPRGNISQVRSEVRIVCKEHALNTLGGIWRRQIHLNWFKNLAELQDRLMFLPGEEPGDKKWCCCNYWSCFSLINTFLLNLWTVTTKWSDKLLPQNSYSTFQLWWRREKYLIVI